MRLSRKTQQGFTLVEMIIVMVLTGIIGGMVAIFIRAPVQGYVDSARRAEMTDVADTAMRRMGRDIRSAAPNSVRVPGGVSTYIEFLPTKAGGRYRADITNGGTGCTTVANSNLDFSMADSCFEIIGSPITFAAGDAIVIGSTQSDGSLSYNTTATGVLRSYTGTVGSQPVVKFTGTQFPASAELPSQRFQVVDGTQQAVTYACTGTLGTLDANQDGQASLVRYANYGFNAVQALPTTPSPPVLADKLSACSFDYSAVNANVGLVAITLKITRGGESVSLYQEIHVNNIP